MILYTTPYHYFIHDPISLFYIWPWHYTSSRYTWPCHYTVYMIILFIHDHQTMSLHMITLYMTINQTMSPFMLTLCMTIRPCHYTWPLYTWPCHCTWWFYTWPCHYTVHDHFIYTWPHYTWPCHYTWPLYTWPCHYNMITLYMTTFYMIMHGPMYIHNQITFSSVCSFVFFISCLHGPPGPTDNQVKLDKVLRKLYTTT
jgi:hypothetical protein